MRRRFLFGSYIVIVMSLLAAAGEPAPQELQAPTYMNAEVLRVDGEANTITLKSESGKTVLQVEGEARESLAGLRENDRVIVTLRVVDGGAGGSRRIVTEVRPASPASGEPGPPASKVVVSAPVPPAAPAPVVNRPVDVAPAELTAVQEGALRAFELGVAQLAVQANAIDGMWLGYQEACLTEPPATNRSRGWFQLLDGTLPEPDQDGCRQQLQEIVRRGEKLRDEVKLAEDNARKAEVLPGLLRESLVRHRLDF